MKKSKRIIAVIAFFAVLLMSLSACFGESKNNEDINNSVSDTEETIKNEYKASDNEEIVENDEKAQVRFQDRRIEEEHPELVELFDMTAGEIKEKYGELEFEYSVAGPGAPFYSIENLPGVLAGFTFDTLTESLSDDMKTNGIRIRDEYDGEIVGIEIGDKLEDMEQPIIWDEVVYILSEGTFYVEAHLGDYLLEVYLEYDPDVIDMLYNLSLEGKLEAWKEEFRQNAKGEVGLFELRKIPFKSSLRALNDFTPKQDAALFSASPVGGNPTFYIFEKGLIYYVNYSDTGEAFECEICLPNGYDDGSIVYVSAGAGSGELTFIVEAESCIDKAYFEYVFLFEKDSLINSILTPIHVSRLSEKPSFIE